MMLFHLEQTDMNDLIWTFFRTGVDYSVQVKELSHFVASFKARMWMNSLCKFREKPEGQSCKETLYYHPYAAANILYIFFSFKKKEEKSYFKK